MRTNTNVQKVEPDNFSPAIPANAARDYITDMLDELCIVAAQSGQEDLHILLKLTTQAAKNSA